MRRVLHEPRNLVDDPARLGRACFWADDWADMAQCKMPIPAFASQVPAARVLRFGDSAGTK
jgi:hypothetical protein